MESLFFVPAFGCCPAEYRALPGGGRGIQKARDRVYFLSFLLLFAGVLGRILLFKNIFLENNFQNIESLLLYCVFDIFLLYSTYVYTQIHHNSAKLPKLANRRSSALVKQSLRLYSGGFFPSALGRCGLAFCPCLPRCRALICQLEQPGLIMGEIYV